MERFIFHVDVNSAFLSWEAVQRIKEGETLDIRKVPSVVAGDPKNRHGVVLAKSTSAKDFGIKTGEALFSAMKKCPNLVSVSPRHDLYVKFSSDMLTLLSSYTPVLEKYSIDECFCDFTGMVGDRGEATKLAVKLKEDIKNSLGFTVNIGISNNKLLCKMASDFKKPDRVHTLYPEEIESKMWPLPVEQLFMVGKATVPKLHRLNIHTIGELAKYDINILRDHLKSHGVILWNYANGIENSQVDEKARIKNKGMGNSTTTPFDIKDMEEAHKVLISLCENLGVRLRKTDSRCSVISVSLGFHDFTGFSKQKKLQTPTDSTSRIMEVSFKLFHEMWDKTPIRKMGVYVSQLSSEEFYQLSLFDFNKSEKDKSLDRALDSIKEKYGERAVIRSCLIKGKK